MHRSGRAGRVWLIHTSALHHCPAGPDASGEDADGRHGARWWESESSYASDSGSAASDGGGSWAGEVRTANRAVLAEARDGAKLYYMIADMSEETLLLLSSDRFFRSSHKGDYLPDVLDLEDTVEGSVFVRKLIGGPKGRFEVVDVPPQWKGTVVEALGECDSDYEVLFLRSERSTASRASARELYDVADGVAAINAGIVADAPHAARVRYVLGGGLFLVSGNKAFPEHRDHLDLVRADPEVTSGRLVIRQLNPTVVVEGTLNDVQKKVVAAAVRAACAHELRYADAATAAPSARRTAFAESFISTEPGGGWWEPLDEAALAEANRAALEGTPTAPDLFEAIDPDRPAGASHELHFIFGKNVLLISKDDNFRAHTPANRAYVRKRSEGDERITGLLLAHGRDPATGRGWRLEVISDESMTGEQQHRLRLALGKITRLEVVFFN